MPGGNLVSHLLRPRIQFRGTFQTNVGTANNDDVLGRLPWWIPHA
jgi:hypothetical protein